MSVTFILRIRGNRHGMELRIHRRRRRELIAAVALGLAVSASAVTPIASSQTACWRAVIGDWSNGGIDHAHPLRCYRSALHNLPNDIRTYTTAEDDIRRELLDEIRSLRKTGADASIAVRAVGRRSAAAERTAAPRTAAPTRALQGRVPRPPAVAESTAQAAATSPPLRALVAAGLAMALVLAAALGKYQVYRRGQRRMG